MSKIVKNGAVIVCLFFLFNTYAQTNTVTDTVPKNNVRESIRPNNVITIALGFTVPNGDLPNPLSELNAHIGYKRFIGSNLNINFTYNKFNIAFRDVYNEGFMSFDLNLEYLLFSDKHFSPFIYAGPGLNAANYFSQSDFKFQAGVGVEIMVSDGLGIKLQADRNFLSTDLLDGLEAGGGSDSFYRIGIGTNIYFPVRKKLKGDEPTIIKANPIEY